MEVKLEQEVARALRQGDVLLDLSPTITPTFINLITSSPPRMTFQL